MATAKRVLLDRPQPPLVAIMADYDGLALVSHAMSCGARAVLSPGMASETIVKVLDIVAAGGTFVPVGATGADRREVATAGARAEIDRAPAAPWQYRYPRS